VKQTQEQQTDLEPLEESIAHFCKQQFRFCKGPVVYLAVLETQLLT
jgi:hypothetical protein